MQSLSSPKIAFLHEVSNYPMYVRVCGANSNTVVGWGSTQSDPGFGAVQDNASIKAKVINLINATRTIMRGTEPVEYMKAPI